MARSSHTRTVCLLNRWTKCQNAANRQAGRSQGECGVKQMEAIDRPHQAELRRTELKQGSKRSRYSLFFSINRGHFFPTFHFFAFHFLIHSFTYSHFFTFLSICPSSYNYTPRIQFNIPVMTSIFEVSPRCKELQKKLLDFVEVQNSSQLACRCFQLRTWIPAAIKVSRHRDRSHA